MKARTQKYIILSFILTSAWLLSGTQAQAFEKLSSKKIDIEQSSSDIDSTAHSSNISPLFFVPQNVFTPQPQVQKTLIRTKKRPQLIYLLFKTGLSPPTLSFFRI